MVVDCDGRDCLEPTGEDNRIFCDAAGGIKASPADDFCSDGFGLICTNLGWMLTGSLGWMGRGVLCNIISGGAVVLTAGLNVRPGRVLWMIILEPCARLRQKDVSEVGGAGNTFPGSNPINWGGTGLSEGQPGPTANRDG